MQNNELTDPEDLAEEAPNWRFDNVDNAGLTDSEGRAIPNRFQWERRNLLMMNSDIAIVRDLTGRIDANGDVDCTFQVANRGSRCPLAETLTKAGIYRDNNRAWLEDFQEAFQMMLEKNL